MRFLATAVLAVSMAGCGTIIHGNDQEIMITTSPSGARVLYDGAVRGITPCKVDVSRRPLKTILTVQKEGYGDKNLTIKNKVSLWALLGNVVLGGVPGWIIDGATGSFGAYYTDTYLLDLEPLETTETASHTEASTVADTHSPPPEQE